jgi:hypothetical protein
VWAVGKITTRNEAIVDSPSQLARKLVELPPSLPVSTMTSRPSRQGMRRSFTQAGGDSLYHCWLMIRTSGMMPPPPEAGSDGLLRSSESKTITSIDCEQRMLSRIKLWTSNFHVERFFIAGGCKADAPVQRCACGWQLHPPARASTNLFGIV